MTVAVGDTVAHGYHWRRGKGMDWWSGRPSTGEIPRGGGTTLPIHRHGHTLDFETTKTRTRIQSPTFDGGRNYHR